jgi:hypothetical protein
MPTIPKIVTLTNSSVDILNAIRNDSTQNYRDHVPLATANAESLKTIGAIIMDDPALQNNFASALINRIGRVVVTSKSYSNPLRMFKKGILEFGETIEEIFVNIAKPFQYDPSGAESTIYKRQMPDIKSAFHIRNYQKFYKDTISEDDLRTAFLSWQGITDLVAKIVDSMYTASEYDEFQVMKYMLARQILKGQMYVVPVDAVTSANMPAIVTDIKATSNDMVFMKDKYNLAGVKTHSPKEDQYIIVNTIFDAKMDVEVLATAFNMDKAQFMGKRVLIDTFGSIDNERLTELFADDTTYVALTDAEKTALDAIPAIIVDKDWFYVFDNFFKVNNKYNEEGLYWNYWYHTWKTFSVSPFACNAIFVPGTPAVTGVTITPATRTVAKGDSTNFVATVVTAYFASQAVDWSIDSNTSSIDTAGNLHVSADEAGATITVTAKSVFDPTKTATAVVTVA